MMNDLFAIGNRMPSVDSSVRATPPLSRKNGEFDEKLEVQISGASENRAQSPLKSETAPSGRIGGESRSEAGRTSEGPAPAPITESRQGQRVVAEDKEEDLKVAQDQTLFGLVSPVVIPLTLPKVARDLLTEQEEIKTQAMGDFLSAAESQFGIKPRDVLEAFAELEQQVLMGPAQDSAPAFAEQFGLPPEQTAQLEALYRDLLSETEKADLTQKVIGFENGVEFKVMSREEHAQQALQQAIDRLTSNFVMREGRPPSEAESALRLAERFEAEVLGLAAPDRNAQSSEVESTAVPKAPEGLQRTEMVGSAGVMQSAGPFGSQSESTGQQSANDNAHNLNAQAENAATAQAPEAADAAPEFELDIPVTPAVTAGSSPQVRSIPVGPMALTDLNTVATPEDQAQNTRDLIQRAQVLARDGGGEVKMALRPEGLGQVEIKVAVVNGQVSVQMITESREAKKAIERSLDELRTQLVAQKLHLDTLKIESAQESQQKTLDGREGESGRESSRQFAQDFMNQRREERQAWSQDFLGRDLGRGYQRNQARVPVTPESADVRVKSGQGPGRLSVVV